MITEMPKQETNNKMNHRSLRQSIEQVDVKGGVHPMEKGKKQLTGEQGWSRMTESIRGDGNVGGTSGDGGATKKRAQVAAVASRGCDGGEPRAADGGLTVANRGRQMVAKDEK
jgi:hypothetical protein